MAWCIVTPRSLSKHGSAIIASPTPTSTPHPPSPSPLPPYPQVPVWRDSDLAAVAAEFAGKHGLPRKVARRLERMLTAQRDAVVTAQVDAPPTPAAAGLAASAASAAAPRGIPA